MKKSRITLLKLPKNIYLWSTNLTTMKYFKHFYSVIIFVFLRLIFCVTKKVSVIITSYENNNTKIIWVQICTLWETYYFWNKLVILPPLTFFGNKDHFLIFMCHAVIEVAYETNATLNRLTPHSFSPSTNVFLLVFNLVLFCYRQDIIPTIQFSCIIT